MRTLLQALGAIQRPVAVAPRMEMTVMALSRDQKAENFGKVKRWAADAGIADFANDDSDVAECVTPFFKSNSWV